MKDEIIRFRCSPEFKRLVEQLAKNQNRTVSNYLVTLVEEQAKQEKKKKDAE